QPNLIRHRPGRRRSSREQVLLIERRDKTQCLEGYRALGQAPRQHARGCQAELCAPGGARLLFRRFARPSPRKARREAARRGIDHAVGRGSSAVDPPPTLAQRVARRRLVNTGFMSNGAGTKIDVHEVVPRDEWMERRRELLEREKEFTRARDELSRRRRDLPWVKVEKRYLFDGPNGSESLSDLFDGRNQLIVYHFMY